MSRVDKTNSTTVRLVQGAGQRESQNHVPHGTRNVLEALLNSAKAISEDKAMNHVLAGVERIPNLEAELRRCHEQEEIAKSTRQQALEDYDIQRDKWMTEKQRCEKTVEDLQKQLSQEKKENGSLKTAKEQHSRQISSLEDSVAQSNMNEENNRRQIQGLINAIKSEKDKNAALEEELKASTAKTVDARAEAQEIQKSYEKLKKHADWHMQKLEAAAALTVPVTDDAKVVDGIDAVWHGAASLICSTFYGNLDLNDPKTKAFWASYELEGGLSNVLPLPQSNSEAAIQMRCVAILAYLARTFVHELFQPT